MKQSFFLIICLFLFSCVNLETNYLKKDFLKKTETQKISKEQNQIWNQIQNQKNKSLSERLKIISSFIEMNKNHEIVLKAYLLKANLLFKAKKPKEACKIYQKLVQNFVSFKKPLEIYKGSSLCYFQKGNLNKAFSLLEKVIKTFDLSLENKKLIAEMQWSFLETEKFFIKEKLTVLSSLFLFSKEEKEKQIWKTKGKNLIEALSSKDLIFYAHQVESSLFSSYLLYKMGLYLWDKGDVLEAKKYLKQALKQPFDLAQKKEIKTKLKLLKQSSRVNPYLIGVLVPLSGRRKALGEKILKGLILGFGLNQDSPWQIIVLDSKSHPDVVREHLESLLYKHRVMGLIGGFTHETAEVIVKHAEEFLIPAILFSQKEGLALNKEFVFQNATTPGQILNFLIKQVHKKLKIKKVAILYPEDSYGESYMQAFSEIFTNQGGRIVKKQAYKYGEVDFKISIRNLLQLNLKGREQEFEKLKKEFLRKKDVLKVRDRKLTPENLLPIRKEFEALFVPDSIDQVRKIKDHLKYFGVKKLYFLGTNLWNPNTKLVKFKGFTLAFVNLWKEKHLIQKTSFYKDFVKSYGELPGIFEKRAYDSALFFKQALNQKVQSRILFQKELKKIKKIQTLSHPVFISREGLFEYPLDFYIESF